MKQVEIGPLYNSLAEIEAVKGTIKLSEDKLKGLIAPFIVISGSEQTVFVTATGQKAASVNWQTRKTISAELLLAAGVAQTTIDACLVECKPFSVFRVN